MYVLVCECTYVMSEVNFLCMHLHHHGSSLILVCIGCFGHFKLSGYLAF